MQYKRILLKLSGEALMGERQHGIGQKRLSEYAEDIKTVLDQGILRAIFVYNFLGDTPIYITAKAKKAPTKGRSLFY